MSDQDRAISVAHLGPLETCPGSYERANPGIVEVDLCSKCGQPVYLRKFRKLGGERGLEKHLRKKQAKDSTITTRAD